MSDDDVFFGESPALPPSLVTELRVAVLDRYHAAQAGWAYFFWSLPSMREMYPRSTQYLHSTL